MPFKNRIGQIIKLLMAGKTDISLPIRLPRVKTTFFDFVRATMWAGYPIWPAQLANSFVTFSIIHQVFELDIGHVLILPTRFRSAP